MRNCFAGAALCAALAITAQAQPQTTPSVQATARDGSNLTVYLMTMGQGDAVWERFGHNAIWIHDAERRTDLAYNWGLFDFNDKDFYYRFIRGDMRYWMAGIDFSQTVAFYRESNRTIYLQELNLGPAQRLALRDFVEWNARPENRYYSYDYFRDNCSTRARDALDRVLGGAIRRQTDSIVTQTTYRSHTRRLIQSDHLIYTGIHFGLGQPADRRITAWEEMFLPMRMRESLRSVRVARPDGTSLPLVKSETELFKATRPEEAVAPPRDLAVFLAIGVAVAAALGFVGGLASRRAAPRVFLITAAIWSLVLGTLGTATALLWLFTRHVFAYRNENLFQANVLTLILAFVLLVAAARVKRDKRQTVLAGRLAVIVASLSIAGFIVQVLPAFYQVNGEIIALTLPPNVAIALVLLRQRFT